jgi:Dolichyl-phosphate-mannose-protein mannosyltransferase
MRPKVLRLITSAWFIAAAAFVLRTAYFLYRGHQIPAAVLANVPFQNEVGNVAAAIAQGNGFCCLFRQATGPTAWVAPVYPLIIACVFKIFGIFTLRSFYAAVLLNCLFSSLATIPLFNVGRRIGGQATAALAGWIWAIFPSGIILPFQWIWDTSLSVLLAATLLWTTLELKETVRRRDFTLYGLLWGVSLLTNPALATLLPFLLGWILFQHSDPHGLWISRGVLAMGVLSLTCLPWMARNYLQFHRFIPLRSNFPYELWSGNNEIFDPNSREVNLITRYEQVHLYTEQGETEFLHEKLQKALNFIETHRDLYVRLFGRRIVATWLGTESPGHDFARTDSLLVRSIIAWNIIALAGALWGLTKIYLRQHVYFLPLASFPIIFPLTFYLAHTTLRHRHPCDPVVALLMAIAISRVQRRQEQD